MGSVVSEPVRSAENGGGQPAAGRIVGLLHTVPALAETFEADLKALDPKLDAVHFADSWLLSTAISGGVTETVRTRVARDLQRLADAGARAILVTCSSIGEAVEQAAPGIGVPVLRVDAPMAREAVRIAAAGTGGGPGRIAVLATLEATLGPTGRLIEREVAEAGAEVSVEASVVAGAVAARDAGRPDEHDRLIREAVAAAQADVIVLAQASMARAVGDLAVEVPVLTSPAGGMDALLSAVAQTIAAADGPRP